MSSDATPRRGCDVAAVVIGRNEGERLRRCLHSLTGLVRHVVYVDSGSSDGSVAFATDVGAHVVVLDGSAPFTAARARNIGFDRLLTLGDPPSYVQFVDGDCEIEPGWIEAAQRRLDDGPQLGVVFGRRRERYPERSIYNRLCDLEWSVPAGEQTSCGGDAMMRVSALRAVGGYRADLIAGEEPELCVRLRRLGWSIMCLDQPMTIHDAAMVRLSQWWRRSVRAGYSFALGAHIHGDAPERHRVVETRRAWLWGAAIPAAVAVGTAAAGPAALVLLLVYPAQVARLYVRRRGREPIPLASSFFHVLGRFAEATGQLKFVVDRLLGRQAALIEYK